MAPELVRMAAGTSAQATETCGPGGKSSGREAEQRLPLCAPEAV